MENHHQICRICYNPFEEGLMLIQELEKEVLEALSIKIDLSLTDNAMMCLQCRNRMEENFNFKANCIYTEDYITGFAKNDAKVNLRDVIKFSKHLDEQGKGQDACRLCMKFTEDCRTLNYLENENFEMYFPEINLYATDSQAVCTKCYNSLKMYFDFATSCLEWEEKLYNYAAERKQIVNLQDFLKSLNESYVLEVLEDKIDINGEGQSLNIEEVPDIKPVKANIGFTIQAGAYKCEGCSVQTKLKSSMVRHIKLKHCDLSELKFFGCKECNYKTVWKTSLKRHHNFTHTDASELKIYKCKKCKFETKVKTSLTRHYKYVHSDPSKIKMYKCEECTFKTKYKFVYTRHLRFLHIGLSKIYKCKNCSYKTNDERNLFRHYKFVHSDDKMYKYEKYSYDACLQRNFEMKNNHYLTEPSHFIHTDPSKLTIYNCSYCPFESKHKDSLTRHNRMTHNDLSKVTIHKCSECPFKTKNKHTLDQHIYFLHSDPSNLDVYTCSNCTFKTIRKATLRRHQQTVHCDLTTIKLYNCPKCAFMTKYKTAFKRHLLRLHSDTAGEKMLKYEKYSPKME